MTEKRLNTTNLDELVFYEVMRDIYNQRYPIRTWVFIKILKHMLLKIQTESTMYYLMQEVRKHK